MTVLSYQPMHYMYLSKTFLYWLLLLLLQAVETLVLVYKLGFLQGIHSIIKVL